MNSVSLALQCKMSGNKHKQQHTHIPKSCSCLLPIDRNTQLISEILTVLTPLHTQCFFSPTGMTITANKPMGNPSTLSLASRMVQRSYFGLNVVKGKIDGNFIERSCYGNGTRGGASVGILLK